MQKSLNLLFANFFRLVPTWPNGYTFRHLKQQVIVELLDEWEEMLQKLQHHLDRTKMMYEEAVTEIINRDNMEPIHELLGDFILGAISIVTSIPIIVIKPRIERTEDANLMPKTNYYAYVDYLFHRDASTGKDSNLVMMVWNRFDYFCPALPKELVNFTRSATSAKSHIADSIRLVEHIMGDIPGSECSDVLSKTLRYMRAGKENLERTKLTTGTATPAPKTSEVPVPRSLSATVVAKMAHKRAALTIAIAPPEKKAKEDDSAFAKHKDEYKKKVEQAAACDTHLGKNECPCSEVFGMNNKMKEHMEVTHTDPKAWVCPKCGKVLGSKGKLWQHVRHHLGKFKNYCDCPYFDENIKDDEGNMIQQICT